MSRSAIATTAFVLAALAAPSGVMAATRDHNHDGLPDGWETRHHLSLSVNQSTRDQDHDGLNNAGEMHRGTDPRKADSDRDGLKDGAEVRTGNSPRKRDTDGDGIPDGRENAGTVASFANGILTIKLADGSTISGTVSDATHMSCDDENENEIENETTVHNQRRRGATAKTARNGSGGGSSSSVASTTPDQSPADATGHHSNDNGVETEHATEVAHQNGGTCSTTGMTPGAAVHEAEINDTPAGASFSKVAIVS